ncbi:hypothetical protein SAMN05216339_1205 [Nitrosomonas eutropha]|uniref:N-acetyl sugar amidotransferase n=1 Tax=Nitrosomonas eutropha TaxID=916 RepID=A0A1I7JC17_9PROT|nr:hypothetical protein [Nitrosomonas eutropha]SFU82739.1 hypothetical protein SAMN05216339_1205 [Nitrosomonas eutropha]
MSHCKLCLLPHNAPGAEIDSNGTCAFCRSRVPDAKSQFDQLRQKRQLDLEKALQDCRGKGPYDALVCLSGGKDSLYLLYRLKVEYKLNVLAFTTDVNIPDIAWKNIRRTIHKLDIDHLVYRPSAQFYHKLFRYLLMNQEERGAVYTVSYVYAPLFEGDALQVATEKGIPLVLAGYSPGQPEPERMEYEFSHKLITETDWTPPGLRESSEFSEDELARFWNPKHFPVSTHFPRYLAPFHAWDYDQEGMIRKVHELGLVQRRAHGNPIYSNYPINWLLMYSDLKHFGYNPYAPEFSALIREGKASRAYWYFATPVVNFMIKHRLLLGRNTTEQMHQLGLQNDDLQITRPRGAYDPKID